jgi:hypothetical protein
MGAKGPPGLQRNPPGSSLPWADPTRGKSRGLLKSAKSEKLAVATHTSFSGSPECRPAFPGGFLRYGFWVAGLAQMEPCARRIPRASRVCAIIVSPSTRQAVTLARRDGTRLDEVAGTTVFLGIRTIQEQSRGMVPQGSRMRYLWLSMMQELAAASPHRRREEPPFPNRSVLLT